MKRQLTAFVAATAIALSGMSVAAPARADDKDALKLILGAAAVGLLLNQMNKNRKRTPAVTSGPSLDWTPGHQQPATYRGSVPGECVMDVTVNNRLREVVSQRCLREFGMDTRVPAECAFDIRTSVGTRTVYGPQCLRDYGYRIEQARY